MQEDDLVNKTALYFQKLEELQTISAVARYFDRSINTIKKYLEKHPEFVPPGRGNKIKKEDGRILPKNAGRLLNTKQVVFYCPEALNDRIEKIKISKFKRAKYEKALELYLDLDPSDRPRVKNKSTTKDFFTKFYCPIPLFLRLDQFHEDEPNISKNEKIIAAIELFCEKSGV